MGPGDGGIFRDTCLRVCGAVRQWDISKHMHGGMLGSVDSGIFPTWLMVCGAGKQ